MTTTPGCIPSLYGVKTDPKTTFLTHYYWLQSDIKMIIVSFPVPNKPNEFLLIMYPVNTKDGGSVTIGNGTINNDSSMSVTIDGNKYTATWDNTKKQMTFKNITTPTDKDIIITPLYDLSSLDGKCPDVNPASKTFSTWAIVIIIILLLIMFIFLGLFLSSLGKKCETKKKSSI